MPVAAATRSAAQSAKKTWDQARARVGRRQVWSRGGRAHLQLRASREELTDELASDLYEQLSKEDGVRWAEVNRFLHRVIVACDGECPEQRLRDVVDRVERDHGVPHSPMAEPEEHPAESEPFARLGGAARDEPGRHRPRYGAEDVAQKAQGRRDLRVGADDPVPASAEPESVAVEPCGRQEDGPCAGDLGAAVARVGGRAGGSYDLDAGAGSAAGRGAGAPSGLGGPGTAVVRSALLPGRSNRRGAPSAASGAAAGRAH